ncbi:Phospholipid-transporting ATPase ABCA1 [Lamellibrachia satsuma]|nr:Phospholipid-transporting ATPase ABCA1 [Lamellibrachia satsuma]
MANRELGQGAMALTVLIHKFSPRALLVEDMNSELTYQLPNDRRNTQLFQDLFIALDDNIKTLGFSSYGISDTTLEEVFLKVTETNELDSAETLDRLTDRGMVASPVNRRSFRRKHLLNLLGEKEGHSQEDGVESSSEADGSVSGVMDGRKYNRAVRLHKLVYEALIRLAWKRFLSWLQANHTDDVIDMDETLKTISNLCKDVSQVSLKQVLQNVSSDVPTSCICLKSTLNSCELENGSVLTFWLSYLGIVEILLGVLQASREGHWVLHI